MKILMFSQYFPPHIGGVEKHVYMLSKYLAKRGHTIHILTQQTPQSEPRRKVSDLFTIRLKSLRINFRYDSISNFITGLSKFCLKYIHVYDIVHLHSYTFWQSAELSAFAKLRKVPLIVSIHTDPLAVEKMNKTLFISIIKSLGFHIKMAKKVILISPTHKVAAELLGISRKSVIIPNGVEFERFHNAPRDVTFKRKIGIPDDHTVILYVGRLNRIKGLSYVIKSLHVLVNTHRCKRVCLLLVGPDEGMLSDILSYANRHGIRRNIVYLGVVSEDVLPRIYKIADVFVLPSLQEGLPSTVLEAMAAGVPIVATNVGGVPYLIKSKVTGMLVSPRSVSSIVKAIRTLIDDASLREKIRKNATYIAKEHDWNVIAEEVERVYYDIVNKA